MIMVWKIPDSSEMSNVTVTSPEKAMRLRYTPAPFQVSTGTGCPAVMQVKVASLSTYVMSMVGTLSQRSEEVAVAIPNAEVMVSTAQLASR